MISSTLGAPFGGTVRGGHHSLDPWSVSLITPPNLGGGDGSCLPSRVIVALGDPSVPLTCWAIAPGGRVTPIRRLNDSVRVILMTCSCFVQCIGNPHDSWMCRSAVRGGRPGGSGGNS